MDSNQVIAALIGGYGALGAAFVWVLKRLFERDERTTNRFLNTMESVIQRATFAQEQTADAMSALTGAITEETTTAREARAHDREEHRLILDGIGKMRARER